MVVDPVPHPQDQYHNNKSLIASNLAQGTNNTASNALTPQSNNQPDQIDQNKSLHKNILKKEQDKKSSCSKRY